MAEPILNVRDVPVGVGEMYTNRVPQNVNVAAVSGQVGHGSVAVKEPVDLTTRERSVTMTAAAQEVYRTRRPLIEVARKEFLASRMQRIRA